jgi:chromosome segregation ATPase
MEQQGIGVNNLNKLTRLQLEQKIIYYKSELSHYKSKIKVYEEDYHYSQLKKIKVDNAKLKQDLKEFSEQIKSIEKEKTILQEKVAELKEEINTKMIELTNMKTNHEKEIQKKNELIEKLQMGGGKQKPIQKELEEFIMALTEKMDEVLTESKINKFAPTTDLKEKRLYEELQKEKKNRDTFQQEMQSKITQLAFLQTSGVGNRFQNHIEMLAQQINEYGKELAKSGNTINQLEEEIENFKK